MTQLLSSKRVVTEISTLLRRSNTWQRGRSYAPASVPSLTPEDRKPQTRVSKSDRKILVKAFVDRYKAANSGKFPSPSAAQKEVGGGYYFIRQIVQEIEYESTHPSINTSKIPSSEEKAKENMLVTEAKEVLVKEGTSIEAQTSVTSSSEEKAKENMPETKVEEVLLKEGTDSTEAIKIAEDLSANSGTENVLKDSGDKFQEFDERRKPIEDVDIHQTTPKIASDEDQQKPKPERMDTTVKAENIENQKNSSMWGSIKSMANGFISMLKKM